MDKDQFSASNSQQPADREKWGGPGISMSVRANGATIEFDCAEAEINGGFSTAAGSSFYMSGTYLRHAPGAIREDFKPKPVPALFEGKILGDEMTLRISDKADGELIGSFTLERARAGTIHRCL